MNSSDSKARLMKSAAFGILAGLVVLVVFLLPSVISVFHKRSQEAVLQEKLISARGEAFSDIVNAEVSLRVVLDGVPVPGMSASVDHNNWYIPVDGIVTLAQAPGYFDRIAATYQNRIVWIGHEINTDSQNELLLDVAWAPEAPEYIFLEIAKGARIIIPLGITGGEEIDLISAPNGALVIRDGTGFSLSLDGSLLPNGFSHIALKAVNKYGYALMHIGLRVPRETEIIPIYTAEDMNNIRYKRSGNYLLMNDIDMSCVDDWRQIGSDDYPFVGVFDGGGYEIIGLHNPVELLEEWFSLFGEIKNAEIRNLVIREPDILLNDPEKPHCAGPLCWNALSSFVENCASIRGSVISSRSGGLIGGILEDGVAIGCFNSSDVTSTAPNREGPHSGGITAGLYKNSYMATCANEGEMYGAHLTGGVTAFIHDSALYRCISSGYIWGHTLVGEILPGGIMHTTDQGFAAYGYFTLGSAPIGGNVFEPYGVANSLLPISPHELRNVESLPLIGTFDGDSPDWAFASLDANGPVPHDIFKNTTEPIVLPASGNRIELPKKDGVRYFYTLNGTNPYTNCRIPVDSLVITLSKGQMLTVFAARKGCRDSEIATYPWQGEG